MVDVGVVVDVEVVVVLVVVVVVVLVVVNQSSRFSCNGMDCSFIGHIELEPEIQHVCKMNLTSTSMDVVQCYDRYIPKIRPYFQQPHSNTHVQPIIRILALRGIFFQKKHASDRLNMCANKLTEAKAGDV